MKRKRAKTNKHARLEARAELSLLDHPVGDPDDDSESDDDGAAENFRKHGNCIIPCIDM